MSVIDPGEDQRIAHARDLEELCDRLLALESLVEICFVHRTDPEVFEYLLRHATCGLFARADRLRAFELVRHGTILPGGEQPQQAVESR